MKKQRNLLWFYMRAKQIYFCISLQYPNEMTNCIFFFQFPIQQSVLSDSIGWQLQQPLPASLPHRINTQLSGFYCMSCQIRFQSEIAKSYNSSFHRIWVVQIQRQQQQQKPNRSKVDCNLHLLIDTTAWTTTTTTKEYFASKCKLIVC